MTRSTSWLLLGALALAACTTGAARTKASELDPTGDFELGDPPPEETPMDTVVDEEAGAAFDAPKRPSTRDASAPKDPPPDADAPKTFCAAPLAAGDLAIVELMVSARAGSGDDGEWVEIQSTRDCWLRLDGVSVESPRGADVDAVAISALELAPHGTFVVADSADPAKNHALPGTVLSWNATDVLKNSGDTISVKLGDAVIDTLTYPSFTNLEAGRTLAFPSDCAPGVRSDWARWSLAFGAWVPGQAFEGTPNAANDDVACY